MTPTSLLAPGGLPPAIYVIDDRGNYVITDNFSSPAFVITQALTNKVGSAPSEGRRRRIPIEQLREILRAQGNPWADELEDAPRVAVEKKRPASRKKKSKKAKAVPKEAPPEEAAEPAPPPPWAAPKEPNDDDEAIFLFNALLALRAKEQEDIDDDDEEVIPVFLEMMDR